MMKDVNHAPKQETDTTLASEVDEVRQSIKRMVRGFIWCILCQRNVEPTEGGECIRCRGQADLYDIGVRD